MSIQVVLGLCVLAFAFSSPFTSNHTNNWAVLVCTSRYWFNYRHIANALSLYRIVKQRGIPDNQIILMLPDDMACNARNSFPGRVYNNRGHQLDLYGDDIEVDYRGTDVTVENFLRLLTGRQEAHVPRSMRLNTDERSNILIYMTGHGGNEFLKFQDKEEISSKDLGDALEQMHKQKRYNEIFFMVDTCQASTLHKRFYSPNVVAIGSSLKDENSYSHHMDSTLGLSVIDRFTYYTLEFMESNHDGSATIRDLFNSYNPKVLMSTPGVNERLFRRPLDYVLISDFFGAVTHVQTTPFSYNLSAPILSEPSIFQPPLIETSNTARAHASIPSPNKQISLDRHFFVPLLVLSLFVVAGLVVDKRLSS
jgi:phosphatidylinositol glycan class K